MNPLAQEVKSLIGKGEFFKAYDIALQALNSDPDNTVLKHRALLALANAGAYQLALSQPGHTLGRHCIESTSKPAHHAI